MVRHPEHDTSSWRLSTKVFISMRKDKMGLEMKYLKQWGLVDINIPYVFVRLLILTNHAREVRHAV